MRHGRTRISLNGRGTCTDLYQLGPGAMTSQTGGPRGPRRYSPTAVPERAHLLLPPSPHLCTRRASRCCLPCPRAPHPRTLAHPSLRTRMLLRLPMPMGQRPRARALEASSPVVSAPSTTDISIPPMPTTTGATTGPEVNVSAPSAPASDTSAPSTLPTP